MAIENNHVVYFHYTLSDINGDVIEASQGADNENAAPVACLMGYGNILPALEDEILGKAAGDEFKVELTPEKAYGPIIDGSIQRIPIKHVAHSGSKKLRPGQAVKINTDKGPRDVRIVKVGKFNVDVDTNHPLAGRTLVFDIKITDVRDATAEELAHRHVHGEGGHHH